MNELVALLEASGETTFASFTAAARSQGLRPELWLRAKQAGLLHTWIASDGTLMIAAGAAEGAGA